MSAKSPDTTLLDRAMELADRLSVEDQDALLMHLLDRLAEAASEPLPASDDDWALRGAQLEFMQQRHQAIEAAYARGDMAALGQIAASPEYQALFGSMPWDEAYDRYEETWWSEDDAPQDPASMAD